MGIAKKLCHHIQIACNECKIRTDFQEIGRADGQNEREGADGGK